MRIDRLDLARYGRFTGASLPFGPAADGKPDLHILYGDNEAGKTTTLNAMLDLVFGIEAATPYKFLHQAAALRLGGILEIGGTAREVVRLPKTALLDAEERPLPEGLFSEDLAGLDRATYQSMFSLDEKTLSAGGESILASRGDLGQLLFSATAGLADFSDALAKVRAETETFYKVHGRKHDLGDLKRQLADLKEKRAAIDVTAAPFARMIAARDDAQKGYEAAVGERGRLQAELSSVRRYLATLPRLAEWQRLKAEHDLLPEGPGVPKGWPETLAELQKTLVALGTRRAAAKEEVERLAEESERLLIDKAGLAVAARVTRLADLRARDATAAKDLPERRVALRIAEARVTDLLGDLDRADCEKPRQLALSSAFVNRLRQHIETLSGLNAAQREAMVELADAQGRHAEGAAALEGMQVGANGAALAQLDNVLAAAAADDSTSRLRLAERALHAHGEVLGERLAALAPWQGTAKALAVLDLPTRAECERFEQGLAQAQSRLATWRGEADRLDDEIRRATRSRDGIVAEHQLVDDAAAAASRSARDQAWSVHLGCLDSDSATAFEQALRADDHTTRARFAQAADLSEVRSLNRSLGISVADREVAQTRMEAAERECQSLQAQIAARFAAFVGASCEAPLAAFESFLVKRERALDVRDLMRTAAADRAMALSSAADMRERLLAALGEVGIAAPAEPSLDAAIGAVRAAVDILQAAEAARARVESLSRDVAERERQAHRADQGQALWLETWQQMLQSTWLAGKDVSEVRDALTTLAELGPAVDARDGLADRVSKMEADREAFAAMIAEAARELGIADDVAITELANRVETRLREATAVATSRAAKIEDCKRARGRLEELRPALEAAETRAGQMTTVFAVATLDELALALDAARRREDLGSRLRDLEVELCAACATTTIEVALAELTVMDRAELEASEAELAARCEDQVEHAQEAFAALGRARDVVTAVNGDAAAARLEEERRTILLEIEERTMTHLALRAGIIAAEGAISLYRDRHRSSMMMHASELFVRLTRGAYSGLAAQSAKDGEVLVGLVAAGGSKLSTEMSTATRHQLYLALRIAAYREFTKSRRPLPFVLDDVLETFDDDRAETTLVLLADMAKTGQVIYLTHHKHLCAIAQRVCPEAVMHDLGRLV